MPFFFHVNHTRQEAAAPRNGFTMQGPGFQPAGGLDQIFAGGLEQVFADVFANPSAVPGAAFFEGAFQPPEEFEPRQPATAEAYLRTMPVLKVTEHDLEAGNGECSICLDKLMLGDSAVRIPCGHLFHEDCGRKCLESSNQCPLCRYELPTDDATFESARRSRMVNWRPRLRVNDLSVKSVRELRHLAGHLGVCTEGCLEKPDLVDAIIESGRVEIIPVAPKTPSTDSAPVLGPGISRRSAEGLEMPAIEDGQPTVLALPAVKSFLGSSACLAALSKRYVGTSPDTTKPDSEPTSQPASAITSTPE